MSRFSKLTYVIWHCQYHIIWVPKYRYRVLEGKLKYEVSKSIRVYSERLGCELVELNVQPEHVHVLIKVPSKVSIWRLMGTLKGKTTLQMFRQFPYLKEKPYWGNHFWAKGFTLQWRVAMSNSQSKRKLFFVSSFLLITLPSCSTEWWKKTGYEISNHYACEHQEPNLPDKVRKCYEEKMSYEEYKKERDKTLSEWQ